MSIALARLDERRAAAQLAMLVPESRAFAGGTAACSGPDTFHNRVFGAGLTGPVADAELDAMVEFYRGHDISPQVELTPFVDPSLIAGLATHGFVLRELRQLLMLELDAPESRSRNQPRNLEIRDVDRTDDAAVELAIRQSMAGFFAPGQAIAEPTIVLARRMFGLARTRACVAYIDGEPVGAGSIDLDDELAYLSGCSVAPEFRSRGVHQALMLHRLAWARAHGCRFATIGARPDTTTERNALRLGFRIAYSKALLVRASE